MKLNDMDIPQDAKIIAGLNVTVDYDKESNSLVISAPQANTTTIRHGAFKLQGEEVVVQAGDNIVLSSEHPNKLKIGTTFGKELSRILALEKRTANLELALSSLLRKQGANDK